MSSKPPAETSDDEEKIINWQDEATSIINDIKSHVAEIVISTLLPCDECNIYLNLRTIEGATCCIHASAKGFRIVSEQYDKIDDNKRIINDEEEEIFETPYALLDRLSPRYVESFGNQLSQKLLQLQLTRTQFNEEDEEGLEEEDEEDDEHGGGGEVAAEKL